MGLPGAGRDAAAGAAGRHRADPAALWLSRQLRAGSRAAAPAGLAVYFFLLGLPSCSSMAFIQKFILFLSHPLYAVAVVAGFLVCAGLGCGCSPWLARRVRGGARDAVAAAVALLVAIVLLYLFLLPPLFERLIGHGDATRIAVSLALIAPLAFCMGMPFPLGLRRLTAEAPGFIPWAWGLNGFASVLSAALATLLAIEFGFNAGAAGGDGVLPGRCCVFNAELQP
jgi:hypothetical protein